MESNQTPLSRDYFRRDQGSGISPPDLSKDFTYAEHIVRARGKRTQFTSVSLDLAKLRGFGDTDYKLDRPKTVADGHFLIEHENLMAELQKVVMEGEKADRLRAVQAIRYAKRRKERLVRWNFNISTIARKDLIGWAGAKVQDYFSQVQ